MRIFASTLLGCLLALPALAQQVPPADEVMKAVSRGKAYTMVLLHKGPNRGKETAEAGKKTQMAHLQYLFSLKARGILPIFGPFDDDGDIRGIGISPLTDTTELRKIFAEDPHVKAGNLIVRFRPWFGLPGDSLN